VSKPKRNPASAEVIDQKRRRPLMRLEDQVTLPVAVIRFGVLTIDFVDLEP